MSYMQEADAWLEQVLEPTDPTESEERWKARTKEVIKAKLLESYRNGQRDCPRCNPRRGPARAKVAV